MTDTILGIVLVMGSSFGFGLIVGGAWAWRIAHRSGVLETKQ